MVALIPAVCELGVGEKRLSDRPQCETRPQKKGQDQLTIFIKSLSRL